MRVVCAKKWRHRNNMDFDLFNTIEIDGKNYFWRNVVKFIDENEERHYRVAELSLEDCLANNAENDFFNSDYDPSVYFAPLEILEKDDIDVVEWCENHNMYFD